MTNLITRLTPDDVYGNFLDVGAAFGITRGELAMNAPALNAPALNTPALIVPGLNNSDEAHWQSLWLKELNASQRIQLTDWHLPDLDKWRGAIRQYLANFDRPVMLVGHSFGALAAASIAAEMPEKIAGLFLVAPADPKKFGVAQRLPQQPIRVPGVLISSDNDPWIKDSDAAYLALLWGIDFLRLKGLGHINSHSEIGIWPEGLSQYEKLVVRVTSTRSTIY